MEFPQCWKSIAIPSAANHKFSLGSVKFYAARQPYGSHLCGSPAGPPLSSHLAERRILPPTLSVFSSALSVAAPRHPSPRKLRTSRGLLIHARFGRRSDDSRVPRTTTGAARRPQIFVRCAVTDRLTRTESIPHFAALRQQRDRGWSVVWRRVDLLFDMSNPVSVLSRWVPAWRCARYCFPIWHPFRNHSPLSKDTYSVRSAYTIAAGSADWSSIGSSDVNAPQRHRSEWRTPTAVTSCPSIASTRGRQFLAELTRQLVHCDLRTSGIYSRVVRCAYLHRERQRVALTRNSAVESAESGAHRISRFRCRIT